jgi:ParB family chromosome partitioning protein
MSAAIVPSPAAPLLTIERLAAQLEKAASLDEIAEVRDRAQAIALYARKKAGGLAAAQAAGRVVTEATLKLAGLYAVEASARGEVGRGRIGPDCGPDLSPGKEAVAKAAHVDGSQLRRLRPVLDAPAPKVTAAQHAIEARGEIVTPAALLREVTATTAAEGYDGDEWRTPADLAERVRDVLGEIDLDPASTAEANRTIGATRFYTKRADGLAQPWEGRVYVNPPYSMPLVEHFAGKLLAELDAGRCTAAVALVNNATDTGWFQSLAQRLPFCLIRGRVPFESAHGGACPGPRQGQVAFYAGQEVQRFADVFGQIGAVATTV